MWNVWKHTITLGPPCFAGCRCFHFPDFAQKNGSRDIASATAFGEDFVSQWWCQHGAGSKTTTSLRKHRIFAESAVLQMLRLACEGRVMRNRHRLSFPLESAVPGLAEYLRCGRRFKENTIYNYRDKLAGSRRQGSIGQPPAPSDFVIT